MEQQNQKQLLSRCETMERGMFEFFYSEFESLRAKTGIRQWEQLNEQPDAAKAIHDIIDFMVQECKKPPYHVVRDEVKQRVISRAIVEDQDFIGLNAKFVQRALAKWWMVNGDRVMEAMNQHKPTEKVELTPEQKRKIDEMANRYVAELLQGDGPKLVPKMEHTVAKVEGKEWTSDLERKAIQYPITTPEQVQAHELHLEWARTNFDVRTGDKLPTWKPEREWTESLTEDQRLMIFNRAVK